ncbi:hypothetical protein SO802_023126 [Lithocarpus litseifolius]|uniref:RNase H type-1 domain-containing protein n=1 Tax=Lithocarpus litseifolius TaxID=425828 RepID=A0AAW2C7C2_9ROSI
MAPVESSQCIKSGAAHPAPAHDHPNGKKSTLGANFDAVVFKSLNLAGLGVVVKDWRGEAIDALTTSVPLAQTVVELEALACRRAVQFAKEIGLTQTLASSPMSSFNNFDFALCQRQIGEEGKEMNDSMKFVAELAYEKYMEEEVNVIIEEVNDLSLVTKVLQVPKQEIKEDIQNEGKTFPINFSIEERNCDLLIEKGSYERLEFQEIFTKQDLKVQ